MNDLLSQVIKKHLPSSSLISSKPISGGCINNAYKIETSNGCYFLKSNSASLYEMFLQEETGLKILNELSPIDAPKPIGSGVAKEKSYLLTEWVEAGVPSLKYWNDFGEKLASQHKVSSSHFGLDHDNFIGSLKQSNQQHERWSEFFINERLKPQINLAQSKKLIEVNTLNKFERIFNKLEELIPSEAPSLLHGDLWSGNFMTSGSGEAVIFDPAVHFGHRETELAFTKLFGGFDQAFYQSYHDRFPLEANFEERVDIHNLYPLLVHVNLFGATYLTGIKQTLNRFT